jgi:formylglycine-generating enzyme required for sulfatase activity
MKPLLVTSVVLACVGCTGSSDPTGDLATDQQVSASRWIALDLASGQVVSVDDPVNPADARWRGNTLLFRQVEPGTAKSGRPIADPLAEEDEYPRRSSGHGRFWICAYELTQAQWRLLAGTEPWFAVLPVADLSSFVGDQMPAVGITPLMAETACERLHVDSWSLSLPEAQEWELACTTGLNRRFAWGDTMDAGRAADYAICDATSPQPVGSKQGNTWGIFDVHGNVWEIVRGDYGWEARGGAWDQPLLTARSSNRMPLDYASTGWSMGMRLVLRR